MRIALFATCLVDGLYPSTASATARVLERLGHEVVFPPGQACCGQIHVNSGSFEQAVPVVRNHVAAFEAAEFDVAVAPSGSCVSSLRHQQGMVARRLGHDELAERADALAAHTYELGELLVDVLGVRDAAAELGSWFPHTVTYHPSCHGMRLLRLGDRHSDLLRSVEGLELAELADADQCCGFGGTFSVKNSEVSSAMLADKVRCIGAAGAEVCTGGDASCLLHIGGGLDRLGVDAATVHLAEILAATRSDPWRPRRRRGAAARRSSPPSTMPPRAGRRSA